MSRLFLFISIAFFSFSCVQYVDADSINYKKHELSKISVYTYSEYKPEVISILRKKPNIGVRNGFNKGDGLTDIPHTISDDYINNMITKIINNIIKYKVYEVVAYMYNGKLSFRFYEKEGNYKRLDYYIDKGKDAENYTSHKFLIEDIYVYEVRNAPKLPTNIVNTKSI